MEDEGEAKRRLRNKSGKTLKEALGQGGVQNIFVRRKTAGVQSLSLADLLSFAC